jgi:hypothetical protein
MRATTVVVAAVVSVFGLSLRVIAVEEKQSVNG